MLKTSEKKNHLAGYLDQWADLYIIRESDHAVLSEFAEQSCRPLINAMTSYVWAKPEKDITVQQACDQADIILTDSWGQTPFDKSFQITMDVLGHANNQAKLIPCPPFNEGIEVSKEAIESSYFAGYAQKGHLYMMHKAIIQYLLKNS